MMKVKKTPFLILIVITFLITPLLTFSQENEETEKFKPTFKWNMYAQIWLRYSDLNPGSLVNNEPTSNLVDVSLRRLRIPLSAQLTPKVYVYSILGGNNYNLKTTKSLISILDLYAEYTFSKYLTVGFGKSGWQGLSRWNVRSAYTLMGLDTPLYPLNTVNKDDDIARQLGVWFKGQAGHLDYRLAVTQPLEVTTAPPPGVVDFANNRPRWKTSTYVKYQIFENESNKSAYQAGTYLANKKIFNIGAGFQYQPEAFSNGDAQDPLTTFYDMKHWAMDSFLNLPLNKGNAITAYLGFYDFNYGKGYIRNVGANNPTNGVENGSFNGAGVAFPMMGTGTTWAMQFGYAFETSKLTNTNMVIQPNIAIQHSNFDALNDNMTVYDFTINFLPNGSQSSKISLGYQYRPIFSEDTITNIDYKGMAVLQYQFAFK